LDVFLLALLFYKIEYLTSSHALRDCLAYYYLDKFQKEMLDRLSVFRDTNTR